MHTDTLRSIVAHPQSGVNVGVFLFELHELGTTFLIKHLVNTDTEKAFFKNEKQRKLHFITS